MSSIWFLKIALLSSILGSMPALAQDSDSEGASPPPPSSASSGEPEKKDDADAAAEKALRYKNPPVVPTTDEERKTNCRKFEKEYISFYDKVFFVKNCKKYHLTTEESSKLTRRKVRPLDVDSRTIASLDEGGDFASMDRKASNCKSFNGTYISFNLTTYYVDDCKYRQFLDEASYQEHRRKNHFIDKPILYPDGQDFASLKEGSAFPSILDGETLAKSGFIEILSMDEACRNITGQYVTYLDSIYMINKFKNGKGCWREKIDGSEYSRKKKIGSFRELTSSQARSIPDYDPLTRTADAKDTKDVKETKDAKGSKNTKSIK